MLTSSKLAVKQNNKSKVDSTKTANNGLKQPFRIGKYWKSSSSLDNTQKETTKSDAVKSSNKSKGSVASQLYVVKEELYTSSYHSFHSLENLNLPVDSYGGDVGIDYENKVNPKVANIKSYYDDEPFIDRSSNKFFEDSFISDKTESLINDGVHIFNEKEKNDIFEENDHYSDLAERYINKMRKAEGFLFFNSFFFSYLFKVLNQRCLYKLNLVYSYNKNNNFFYLLILEEKPKDFSCQGIYLEACKKQKVIPASYFLRHMNDSVLKMKHHGLGIPGIKPVSIALVVKLIAKLKNKY